MSFENEIFVMYEYYFYKGIQFFENIAKKGLKNVKKFQHD